MLKPSFDTWTIIFLFAAIQGLFVSAVLLAKKDKNPSRKILAAITILFSTILLEYVLFWTRYQFYYPYLIAVSVNTYFLFGPLFYFYFKSIFNKVSFQKSDLLHFLPFLISFLWFSPYIFKSVKAKQYMLLHHSNESITFVMFFVWLGIIQMSCYQLYSYWNFSSLSKTNPEVNKWFRWLSALFSGFILSYVSYYILTRFAFFNTAWDYAISFSMMFFIFFVAWFGYMQPKVFCGFAMFETEKVKYKNSPISSDLGQEIVTQLEKDMLEKKYFLHSDLSLEKLSELTRNNKHYLSQAINERLQMNFFEYINSLRINEARDLLTSRKDLTIIEIAYQVGYNNKVSFNKAFKNIIGETPSEYRNTN